MCAAAAGAQASRHAHHSASKEHPMTAVADLKRVHRATWAAGDYAAVAELIDEVPPRDLLARMDIAPGHDVLDVATGTGNVALRAAAAGAQVVGLDLTPELFETARRRAAEYGVDGRLGRGRRRGPAVRRRGLRPRALGLRRPVRAAPRGRRGRAASASAGPAAGSGSSTGPRGPDRRAVQDHGPPPPAAAGLRLPAAAVGQRGARARAVRGRAASRSSSPAGSTRGGSTRPSTTSCSWRPTTARP